MKNIGLYIIVALVVLVFILGFKINSLSDSVEVYDNNFKALNLEYSEIKKSAIAYKFDIEQLEYINDSIINELNTARKELKIKDREIKQMQYIKTEISTRDSVFIKDTIFRDDFVRLDTVITDKWHTVAISLQQSKLVIDAKYRSELNVFASSSKEIVGTPKKCFIGRWFQKKHNVIRVDVKDNNPYSEIKSKKFVIIE